MDKLTLKLKKGQTWELTTPQVTRVVRILVNPFFHNETWWVICSEIGYHEPRILTSLVFRIGKKLDG